MEKALRATTSKTQIRSDFIQRSLVVPWRPCSRSRPLSAADSGIQNLRERNKKIQRQKEKAAKKELQKKVGLFSKLADHCLVCQKGFDKKDKEMVNLKSELNK